MVAPGPVWRAPGRAGTGRLSVEQVDGRSAATTVWATNPLRLLVPRARGESVWAYTSSFGGGLVAGDELSLSIDLAPDTRCFVGSQSSTKIYRNPTPRPCRQQVRARVGDRAVLVYAPDPVQTFAGARYEQEQTFELAGDAGLVLVDAFGSGRAACGERWAFHEFSSRSSIRVDGEPAVFDSLRLDPADGALDRPLRLGRFNCLALVAVMGPPFADAAGALLAEVAARPVIRRGALLVSASRVAHGVLLRLAAEAHADAYAEIRRWLSFVGPWLGELPWSRRP